MTTNTHGLHIDSNNTDSRSHGPIQQANDGKDIVMLIAQLALAGHQVYRLESGFLVSHWGMSRHCPHIAALVAFGRILGVKK